MHPSRDELLDLRDGESDPGVANHIRFCGKCERELAELRATASALRALPAFDAPEDCWPQIRDRERRRRKRTSMIRGGAAAASVLAVLTAVAVVRFAAPDEHGQPPRAADARLAVEQLTIASQELEQVLRNPSLRSPVLSPRRAAFIIDIEDRIALVDVALAERNGGLADERVVALWSDRVELLDALVTVRGDLSSEKDIFSAKHAFEGSDR